MTDRYCHPRVHRAARAAGVHAASVRADGASYTRRARVEAVRDAVDMVDLVSARTELRKAGARSYEGLCPFHEERTPSFGIEPVREALPLLRLPGGRATCSSSSQETEGVDFKRRARAARPALRRPAGASRHEDPRDAERRRAARAAAGAARAHGGALRALPLGVARGAATRGTTCRRAGWRRRRCASSASATRPSAWDTGAAGRHAATGSPTTRSTTPGLATRGQAAGSIYDRFRGRITFPLCRLARARARVRRAGDAARSSGRSTSTRRRTTSSTRAASSSAPTSRGRSAAPRRAVGRRCRGLHGRDRAAPGGHAQRGRDHGHRADRATRWASWRGWRTVVLLALDADSAGQEAMLRAAAPGGGAQARAARRAAAAGRRPGGSGRRDGAQAAQRARRAVGAVRPLPRRAGAGDRRPLEPRARIA